MVVLDAPAIVEFVDRVWTEKAKELACRDHYGDASSFRMSVTQSVVNVLEKKEQNEPAVVSVLRMGLEQMREKNEALYFRVIHLEASNKRLKEQLRTLAEVDGKVAKLAKDALAME
jgi:hypothetical protein